MALLRQLGWGCQKQGLKHILGLVNFWKSDEIWEFRISNQNRTNAQTLRRQQLAKLFAEGETKIPKK